MEGISDIFDDLRVWVEARGLAEGWSEAECATVKKMIDELWTCRFDLVAQESRLKLIDCANGESWEIAPTEASDGRSQLSDIHGQLVDVVSAKFEWGYENGRWEDLAIRKSR